MIAIGFCQVYCDQSVLPDKKFIPFYLSSRNMSKEDASVSLKEKEIENASTKSAPSENRSAPKLNERILSSLSRRSVAAHPWHDLDIGDYQNIVSVTSIHWAS